MNPTWLPLVFGVMAIEMLVAQKRPMWLASFARIPFARKREIPLGPDVVQGLSTEVEPLGYREAAARTIDLAKLGGPRTVMRGKIGVFLDFERGLVVARERFGLTNRPRPLVRVDVRAESDRLVLRAGFHPLGVFPALLFFLFVFSLAPVHDTPHDAPWGAGFLVVLFAAGVVYGTTYMRARACLDEATAELRSRVASVPRASVERPRVVVVAADADAESALEEPARAQRRA